MPEEYDDLDFAKTLRVDGRIILAGRYLVVREVGRGGMGVVYLAEDQHLENRQIAVKMLPPVLAKNPRAIKALKKEALLAMQLSHPHIVTLRAFEQSDEGVFLVMDYVEGKSLEDILSEKEKLDEQEVLTIFKPIAEALDYAHRRKVIHRDVKPSNIIIASDGTPFITDFGVAREMKDTFTRVTGKGTSGTMPYMSPEQLRGAPPAPAQDVYSLAASMYECLSGHPPFYRGQIEYQIINDSPEGITGQSDHVNAALLAGLAKQPEERPTSASKLVAQFSRPAPAVIPASQPERPRPEHKLPEPSKTTPVPAAREDRPDKARSCSWRMKLTFAFVFVVAVSVISILSHDSDDSVSTYFHPEGRYASTPNLVKSLTLDCGKGVSMKLVLIPAGKFVMGSPAGEKYREDNEGPQREVTISKAFYMGACEVTQEQYETVMGANPSGFKGAAKYPVEQVYWDDAVEFCKKLSARTGKTVRLPTEAEWEYACRAGTNTRYSFGDDEAEFGEYGWYCKNAYDVGQHYAHAVGQKTPNNWGLYDMHGNVWEWCSDWYGENYYSADANSSDPQGPGSGTYRILRGGGWNNNPQCCRSAYRYWNAPVYRSYNIGFRIAMDFK